MALGTPSPNTRSFGRFFKPALMEVLYFPYFIRQRPQSAIVLCQQVVRAR